MYIFAPGMKLGLRKLKKKCVLYACIGVLTVAALVVWWMATGLFGPVFETKETVYVYVRPSDTEESIMKQLAETACARTMRGWKMASALTDFSVRTGRYAIHPGERMWNVYRNLQRGRQEPVRLTLPSVRTTERLAGWLSAHLMLDSATVAEALREPTFAARYGYEVQTLPALFIPNTYEFYWDISLEQLMQRMVKENEIFWKAEGRDEKAQDLGMSHEQVVTLASIIDEETANNAEKPRVAGMYLNRLRTNMPLQADPTVKFALYEKAREEGRSGDEELAIRRILHGHLLTESPYNTYKNSGLPPGPIRIASVAGIDAVLNHETHSYIYMCAKEDFSGTHNFATTYSEHLVNARRYAAALNARGIK